LCLLAYASRIALNDASITHRALAREGLEMQRATASADGRLGLGRGVSALKASGRPWTAEPMASLWREPLEAQLDRAWLAQGQNRRAGADLVFLRGMVRGVRGQALELRTDSGLAVSGLVASDHPELAYRSNLRLLGSAPGLPLLAVGRVVFGRPRAVLLLAVAAGEPGALELPVSLGDRVNLGLDRLEPWQVRGAGPLPAVVAGHAEDAVSPDRLDALRRRVYQVVSGGRAAVSEAARGGLERDAMALQRAHLPSAALALRALGSATAGNLESEARRERLARAWLVAWTYLGAATARLQRLSWTDT
jgi:hypothetical protein